MYPSEGSEITQENLIKKSRAKRSLSQPGIYLACQRTSGWMEGSLLHFDLHSFSISCLNGREAAWARWALGSLGCRQPELAINSRLLQVDFRQLPAIAGLRAVVQPFPFREILPGVDRSWNTGGQRNDQRALTRCRLSRTEFVP
jgi:hypothetical protein